MSEAKRKVHMRRRKTERMRQHMVKCRGKRNEGDMCIGVEGKYGKEHAVRKQEIC